MRIQQCTREDFFQILNDQERFWGSDRAKAAHHPTVIEEFGETAFTIRVDDEIAAYLFGFFEPKGVYFYIHLVAVDIAHRKQGYASALYSHIESLCLKRGVERIKAITPPSNRRSLQWHKKRGFEFNEGEKDREVVYEPDYSGPGKHMVVMIKNLV